MGGNGWGGYERAQLICLVILTVIATGVALYLLRPVLVPFVLALFITYCLKPPIDLQMRHLKMPRWVAIASTAILLERDVRRHRRLPGAVSPAPSARR